MRGVTTYLFDQLNAMGHEVNIVLFDRYFGPTREPELEHGLVKFGFLIVDSSLLQIRSHLTQKVKLLGEYLG